jgi:hypothetical protein
VAEDRLERRRNQAKPTPAGRCNPRSRLSAR